MLGPLEFIGYTEDLADLINSHQLSHHLYADDQCYFSCDFLVTVSVTVVVFQFLFQFQLCFFQLLFQLYGFSVTVTVILNIYKFYKKTEQNVAFN